MKRWRRFWNWYESFYMSATPILGPTSKGMLMQQSPRVALAKLAAFLSGEGRNADKPDDHAEGCIIDVEDERFYRKVVTPEEFCNMVNARSWVGMTWADAERVFAEVESLVELE